MSLLEFHEVWAWVMIVGNALAGVWALLAHRVVALRSQWLWRYVLVVEVAIGVQVVLGVVLVAGQGIEAPEFHMFYGFVALITVGILYSYRQQLWPHRFLLYGFGSLFLMGLGLRAVVLG